MTPSTQPTAVPIALPPVRQAPPTAVFKWLRMGWQDMLRAGKPSLLHGVIVSLFSLVLTFMLLIFWQLLPGALSGFILTGPILATGLYALSRRLGEGVQPGLGDVVDAWRHASRCLFRFSLLLLAAATAWVAFSVLMFHWFIRVPIDTPIDFLRYLLTQQDSLFLLWTLLGGLGTALAFAITVITVPLLVDRDVNTWLGIRTSVRAVGENPITMLLWALSILVLTGLSFLTGMLGFVVLYPLLGHASWHAYRELVDAQDLPSHDQPG